MTAETGYSTTAVGKAYRRVYGDNGEVDHHAHLTRRQAAELRELWEQGPPSGGRL